MIPAAMQFRIFLRDQNRCSHCRRGAEDGVELNIHHITPRAAGGTDNIHNLKTLCFECTHLSHNTSMLVYAPLKKHNRIPGEYAMGMLTQALSNYRAMNQKQEISIEEATVISNSPQFVRGINPLFSPLPKPAIISAALVLHHSGKIRMDGKLIRF
ncbi:MAG: HNH endonuclease [Candidatus Micrarchaeota archaeon]